MRQWGKSPEKGKGLLMKVSWRNWKQSVGKGLLSLIIAGGIFTAPALSVADVVVLKNGMRLEGIATAAPGGEDAVNVQDYKGTIKIGMDRIDRIEEESDAQDCLRLADQYLDKKEFEKAEQYLEKAREYEPQNAGIGPRMERVAQGKAREQAVARQEEVDTINNLLEEGEAALAREDFEKVESLLKEELADKEPVPSQEKRILALRKQFYKQKALYLEDKLLKDEAANYYEKLLELDPMDEEAYRHLVDIWSEDPAKNLNVINAHKIRLKLHPQDHETRYKLAEKTLEQARLMENQGAPASEVDRWYENAYEELNTLLEQADPGKYRESEIREQMSIALKRLYLRDEARGNYDDAASWYKLRMDKTSEGDQKTLMGLLFREKMEQVPLSAVDGRTSLVLEARDLGLTDLAAKELERLKRTEKGHPAVLRLMQKDAQGLLNQAQQALYEVRYEEADRLAQKAEREYGGMQGVTERVEKIRNQVRVALEREARQLEEEGKNFKEVADGYYNQAMAHLNSYRSREVDNRNIRVMNDKEEAIKNFRLAISNYDKARRYGRSMDNATLQEIRVKRENARRYLNTLSSSQVIRLPEFRDQK